jgi:hypothetical protein
MISQPEYLAHAAQLQEVGQRYERDLSSRLVDVKRQDEAIRLARYVNDLYHQDFQNVLASALAEVGNTVVDHYDKELNLGLSDEEKASVVSRQIMRQVDEPYYGATLGQRVSASKLVSHRRIMRSAVTGKDLETRKINLTRIFVNQYPYGSQVAHDNRILLGQTLKLEHDIALVMGARAEVQIVRWTLSHRHKVRDICDDYAEHIDPAVIMYLKEQNIKVPARGLYFIHSVPEPPHPNCQCSLTMLHEGNFTSTIAERVAEKIKELLGKWRKRRKK